MAEKRQSHRISRPAFRKWGSLMHTFKKGKVGAAVSGGRLGRQDRALTTSTRLQQLEELVEAGIARVGCDSVPLLITKRGIGNHHLQ